MKYRCIRKCYFQSRLFEEGSILTWTGEGKPPRHFVPLEDVVPEPKEEPEPDIKTLWAECDELKIPYDRRWGVKKLENEMLLAKRNREM